MSSYPYAVAVAKGREQLAVALLRSLGVLLGLAVAPVIADYAAADPFGAVAGGRRDRGLRRRPRRLRPRHQPGPLTMGAAAVLGAARPDRVRHHRDLRLDPGRQRHLPVAGLGISGAFTIVDFNRLRHSRDEDGAVAIAASIRLDVFNIFLLLLDLFGGRRDVERGGQRCSSPMRSSASKRSRRW